MSARISILVANPTARTGKAERAISRAMEGLASAGLEPEFFATLPEGKTVAGLADRIEREDVARVVYLGGDGTFAESAKGIILARERSGVDVPLAMLPMGTANDQGRSFGISAGPRALEQNIKTIAGGCEQWMDVGRIEAIDDDGEVIRSDLWFDNCGFGLSARILAQRNRDRELVAKVPLVKQLYRDKLVYAGAAVSQMVKSVVGGPTGSLFSCEVTVDGEVLEWVGLTDLVVNGTILYGGEWIFVEDSRADDGKFEVLPFRSHADWVMSAISRHKKNPVTNDDLEVVGLSGREFRRGQSIELRMFRPNFGPEIPSQIDGEEFVSAQHYRVENLFHHLRIIVPEDPHWI
ncbi:diacylglycerol/lipid kinase family protein [Enhygromyxa salina]|uniref:Putative lipid kinase YtlR n=1 Tax=Enhygromyxa salina TaxID=215803 RepID=A0A2S9YV97_9BACT|nr:diacylglycerol kinase family protein [Enhygromyxa salina]PRQ09004.1 putative lipid kinase YtlR [Enhygromyxa salina]